MLCGTGTDHHIRIQTITTSDITDVTKTMREVTGITYKLAYFATITAQGKKEVGACFDMKNTLVQKQLVANYWKQVSKINDYQKSRFNTMFNTLATREISVLALQSQEKRAPSSIAREFMS